MILDGRSETLTVREALPMPDPFTAGRVSPALMPLCWIDVAAPDVV